MIFTDKPWYNEPGRERATDQAASDRYNSQVQGWTLQHATLYWLNERLARPPGAAPAQPYQSQNNHRNIMKLLQSQGTKKAPGVLSAPKLNPFNPFFDLMDDKPSKSMVKKPLPPKPPKAWEPPKSTPNPPGKLAKKGWASLAPMQPSSAEAKARASAVQPLPNTQEGWEEFVLEHTFGKSLQGMKGAVPIPDATPGKHVPFTPSPKLAHLADPAPLPDWMEADAFTQNVDSFDQYMDAWKAADEDKTFFTPDMDEVMMLMHDELEQAEYAINDNPTRGVPDTNTKIDSNDDYVWGEVIRKHFETKAKKILETAAEWRTTGNGKLPEDPILKQLEDAMAWHGFVPSQEPE